MLASMGTSRRIAIIEARLRAFPDAVVLGVSLLTVVAIVGLDAVYHGYVPVVGLLILPLAAVGWLCRSSLAGWVAVVAVTCASVAFHILRGIPDDARLAVVLAANFIVFLVVLGLLRAVRRLHLEREEAATVDELCQVLNARAFRALAKAEIARTRRYRHTLSVLYVDVDKFKVINDRSGHGEGDRVLHEIGRALNAVVRSTDAVGRLGGDEFVVLMPETDAPAAERIARRLHARFAEILMPSGRSVSCSIGLATFTLPPPSVEAMLSAADRLMYEAKAGGGGRTVQALKGLTGDRIRPGEPAPRSEASARMTGDPSLVHHTLRRPSLPELFQDQFSRVSSATEEDRRAAQKRRRRGA